MKFNLLILLAFLVSAFSPLSASAGFEGYGLYGRTEGFWPTIDAINQKAGAPGEIAQALDDRYGKAEEGIATLKLGYADNLKPGVMPDAINDHFNRYHLAIRADLLAGGLIRDRIYPVADGYMTKTAQTEIGLSKESEEGFQYKFTEISGFGYQDLVQGTALDFIRGVTTDTSMVFIWGVDLEAGYKAKLGENSHDRFLARLSPTFFLTNHTAAVSQNKIEENEFTFRWRMENEWALDVIKSDIGAVEAGVLGITGQNPIPASFLLPRTWDAVHHLGAWPSAGQLLGFGTMAGLHTNDRKASLRVDGGFYGGYFGAGAILNIVGFQAFAGTWGIEQTAGFQLVESRIEYAGMGYSYAL